MSSHSFCGLSYSRIIRTEVNWKCCQMLKPKIADGSKSWKPDDTVNNVTDVFHRHLNYTNLSRKHPEQIKPNLRDKCRHVFIYFRHFFVFLCARPSHSSAEASWAVILLCTKKTSGMGIGFGIQCIWLSLFRFITEWSSFGGMPQHSEFNQYNLICQND